MEYLHLIIAGLSGIILFVFGLDNFSKEIEKISGEQFRNALSSATRYPIIGVLIGAIVTMFIQSSSATSVISIGLVNAGVLSFKNSVGIIFGSNIGTTVTAQLVAFKLTHFAPFFIVLGFILTIMRNRASLFGKAVFYFGFVFFSLNLISTTLEPLQHNPTLIAFLTEPQNPVYAILLGCVFTALVQSSSVTTGLAIIFTQQGMIGLENAVPLILGANIGTTATALIAVFNMDTAAKKAALSHFLFNVGGVVLFLPILFMYGYKLAEFDQNPALALANIHLVFNLTASLIFTVFIGPFTRFVDYVLGDGDMDFDRIVQPQIEPEDNFDTVKQKLNTSTDYLFNFLKENYNAVTLSIETNYKGLYDAAEKRIAYVDFLKKQMQYFFASAITLINQKAESKELLKLINQFDYLFQIHDSIKDLFETKRFLNDSYVELNSDLLLLTRGLSILTLEYFEEIAAEMRDKSSDNQQVVLKEKAKIMQQEINDANRSLLLLMLDPERKDAASLINFVTYSQRLKDKLSNFAHLNVKLTHDIPDAHDAKQ
ncbi:Na/Pi symporter [Alteromonas sp. ASW11-36]|uniref:Na/Pi symporter n=1 Tax=Alteromonas arenosi TaxID=3055817 RepID=A0ABT7SXV0_9ALTE|nr:Na/Pi symporter [Alteromonas sp. ASW11-36]MDM7861007.1 Na/Pi symporter [Alteromonas sp. ASW11-36]